jgi:hypothetical protein
VWPDRKNVYHRTGTKSIKVYLDTLSRSLNEDKRNCQDWAIPVAVFMAMRIVVRVDGEVRRYRDEALIEGISACPNKP